MNQVTRRTFISGALLVPVAAVGMRGVIAGNQTTTGTPEASPQASPGASPQASPMASPAAGSAIEVRAVDIGWDPTTLEIPADQEVTIRVINEGVLQHDFIIEDTDFGTDVLNGGDETELKVTLSAGEYTYFCSVPGHRDAGMEGKLTVS